MGEAATVKGELTDSPDPSKPGSDTKPTKDFGKVFALDTTTGATVGAQLDHTRTFIHSRAQKRTPKPENRPKSIKIYLNNSRALPNKTRVLRQTAPEN